MKADNTIQILTDISPDQWDASVAHPLQSWAWGTFRQSTGIRVIRIGRAGSRPIEQAMQITIHPVPMTGFSVGYIPKGPLPTPDTISELQSIGKTNRILYFQIEPNVGYSGGTVSAMQKNGCIPSHRPLFTQYTFILDLTKTEKQLLSGMHPKTRYNIRLAQKHGVEIRQDNSDEAFERYLELTEETTRRQGFYAHSRQYHQTLWKTLFPANLARIFTARFQSTVIAAWMVFTFGDTVYYPYGATSREHKSVMAPNLMAWEIARWAKQNGYKRFDLWGAMGPDPDPNDPWFGFHRFKQGYGPDLIKYIGSFDLVVHPTAYRLFTIADSLRWKILSLRR